MNYYNEIDPRAAAWLRELIAGGHIPAGFVDERSITEIKTDDLTKYKQCHFFAGIGGWPLALALAGWPASRPVWTGSCPCQPFSAAGSGKGCGDDRHLWPVFRGLIAKLHPERVFGEQVAQAIGFDWLDGVSADLEADGYAVGAAVLGAHSVGAPHIRQRLFWVANSTRSGVERNHRSLPSENATLPRARAGNGRIEKHDSHSQDGCWAGYATTSFRDGVARRTESGTPTLADGLPARVVRLRGYGNAIVPQTAAQFIIATDHISPLNADVLARGESATPSTPEPQ